MSTNNNTAVTVARIACASHLGCQHHVERLAVEPVIEEIDNLQECGGWGMGFQYFRVASITEDQETPGQLYVRATSKRCSENKLTVRSHARCGSD